MKHIKFALLALGILSVLAVFLPYVKIGETSITLWEMGKVASQVGESAMPVYAILLIGLGLAGVTGFAVARKQMNRALAAGALVLCAALLFFTFKMGAPNEGLLKVGSIGVYILVFGGFLGFLASVVAVIKPERGAAA